MYVKNDNSYRKLTCKPFSALCYLQCKKCVRKLYAGWVDIYSWLGRLPNGLGKLVG
jgi:hypothetical protein